jgi:hypothetical protein
MSLYKGMAAQADYNNWELRERNVITKSSGYDPDKMSVYYYDYTHGGSRIEKIEYSPTEKGKILKITNTITLPFTNIFMIGVFIFIQLMFVCMAYGPIAAFLVELFPPEIRYTSLSLPSGEHRKYLFRIVVSDHCSRNYGCIGSIFN